MSRKKGLSVAEKRTRMMEFFYEKKDFFQLKELERQCQKEKGITSMSVKEILTSLVDDGMVDTDKIGTSVYFWAFPSKAVQNRKRKLDELQGRIGELKMQKDKFERKLIEAQRGKEETEERSSLLSQLSAAQQESAALQKDLDRHADCDPKVMEQRKLEVTVAKEAANRWTDNIFSTKSWIKNRFYFEDSVIDKQFAIPPDLDYMD